MPANLSEIEKKLWSSADELRANSNLKASEYSVPVLGLIFLRFADARFSQVERELASYYVLRTAIQPIFSNLAVLIRKNVNLRQARDLLLPKLISDKVDLEELEIAGAKETGEVETKAVEA